MVGSVLSEIQVCLSVGAEWTRGPCSKVPEWVDPLRPSLELQVFVWLGFLSTKASIKFVFRKIIKRTNQILLTFLKREKKKKEKSMKPGFLFILRIYPDFHFTARQRNLARVKLKLHV